MALILGIETSCDETSAAIVRDGTQILSNIVSSQAVHSDFGGVVPELAARAHLRNIVPVVRAALGTARCELRDVDAIAVTQGPGLVGALLVGLTFAKALGFARKLPVVPVHHIEAHLFATRLVPDAPPLDFLALVVSGGHTELIDVAGPRRYEMLGETIDDAAGEAFDKVAKMAGLPYPGGAHVDRLARTGNPRAFDFPRSLLARGSHDFSFSGIKTSVKYLLRDRPELLAPEHLPHLLASFQAAVVDVLVTKTIAAARGRRRVRVALVGGVAANSLLRERLAAAAAREGIALCVPPPSLCTDNAAMVAAAGDDRYLAGDRLPLDAAPSAILPLPSAS
ncbi:MAG: tRNA (adenosine(37)-N6)-threonylcarbamoyltransferase complex transferase subunit TsaD [bacterium]